MLRYRIQPAFSVFLLLLGLALLLIPGCAGDGSSSSSDAEPDQITVLLDWTPNTNYSGMYAALEQGFYTEENLAVEFIQAPAALSRLFRGKSGVRGQLPGRGDFRPPGRIPARFHRRRVQHNTSGLPR